MRMKILSDKKVIDSWGKNASPWTAAVRERQVESRELVTNRAIIDATLSRSPQAVLDIGCGEGWLSRQRCPRTLGLARMRCKEITPSLKLPSTGFALGSSGSWSKRKRTAEKLPSKTSSETCGACLPLR
jgi:hypothetical protein